MDKKNMQRSLFTDNEKRDLFFFEKKTRGKGFQLIAGVDEAGRGPLAGPVIASAVILPTDEEIEGLTDSKKVSPSMRDVLFDKIREKALAIGIGIVDNNEIDSINILQATLSAMGKAVEKLSPQPHYLLIDGISPINTNIPLETIKKGDSLSYSIAAASIMAKVTRDRIMADYDAQYPQYGFASHKGYGAKKHMEAIMQHGPSPIHRKSFSGVKEHVR